MTDVDSIFFNMFGENTNSKTIKEMVNSDVNKNLEKYADKKYLVGRTKNDVKYINCVKYIQETINHLKRNSNFDMSIDNMLFDIWEEVNENNSWS